LTHFRRHGIGCLCRGRSRESFARAPFFPACTLAAHQRGLLSDEHFTVDGTLIEAAASLKSFKRRDGDPPANDGDPGNPSVDFRGEQRSNATHQSTTDPEARLLRKGKGKEAKLAFLAHALMENRNGLLAYFQVTPGTGTAERDAVPMLLEQAKERGLDTRTTRHRGYVLSQRVRKRVEEIFGWMKTVGGFRRTRHRGLDRTGPWRVTW